MNTIDTKVRAKKNLAGRSISEPANPVIGGMWGYFISALVMITFCAVAGLDLKEFTQASSIVAIAGFIVPYFVLKRQNTSYSEVLNAEINRLEGKT